MTLSSTRAKTPLGACSPRPSLVPRHRLCRLPTRTWAAASSGGLSFKRGPDQPPLLRGTIPQHFAETVSRHGSRTALVARSPAPGSHQTELTYNHLDRLSNRLANSLASLGIRKGHRVAVSLGNVPEFVALIFAIYKLGAVLVPLNPAFNAPETGAALSKVDASILIIAAVSDTPYKASRGRCNQPLLAELLGPSPLTSSGRLQLAHLPSLKHIFLLDNRSSHPEAVFRLEAYPALSPYQTLLGGSERPVTPQESLDPSDVINIQFTSGTTSAPKAAMLAHSSILNNGFLVAHRLGLQPSDRIVVPPPLFHCFGSVLGLLATTAVGASILFPSPAFDPIASLRMCADHKATGLYGVTTMFSSILEALDRGGLQDTPSDLVKGIVAGSCVPQALMENLSRRLGLDQLAICYGMTETGPVSCMTRHTDPALKRSSTVGTPMAHTTVKIVSSQDHSRILPFNTRGELATSGYLVMEGYYGDAENTAKVKVDNVDLSRRRGDAAVSWMYSGDEAEMDPDGYVTITGRIKDLIIRGGENIQPLAIENCLCQHPEISEASVVGLPDERLGEVVVAVILLRPSDRPASGRALSPAHVRDWVRARMSTHLVPQHVLFFDQLPKTASGKIRKSEVRNMAANALKLPSSLS